MLLVIYQTLPLGTDCEIGGPRLLVAAMENPPISFVNVSEEVGLSGVRGDSFAWGDWNDDGYQDILVKGRRLFENTGPPAYRFREVTEEVGLENSGYCVWVDLNNDGYLDIFSVGHPYSYQDSVWLNTGPPSYRYENASHLSGPGGVDDRRPGLACGAGDMDLDGDLDIYVVNWRDDDNVKFEDVLWRNEGDGSFTDVTALAGIVDFNENRGEPNAGMGVNWGDFNDDGYPDIYVSNYLITPNYLWENQGDGTFIDVAHEKGCAGEPTQTPQDTYYGHSAGSQWADYDNDGDLDMWTSNLAHKDPYRTWICDDSELWRNNGPEVDFTFTNVRDQTGIPTVRFETEELFFGIAWGDFDNDGDLDMWIPQVKSYIDYAYSYLFRSNGDGTFTDISEEAGLRIWDSDGGAWCDYDNDGDLDLITEGKYPYENGTYEVHLFRNGASGENHYLKVDLEGTTGNPSAVGARIYAYERGSDTLIGMREVEGGTAGHSYGPSLTQEFGLGDYYGEVDLRIRWPWGSGQYVLEASPDSLLKIREPVTVDASVSLDIVDPDLMEGETALLDLTVSNQGESDMKDILLSVSWDSGEVVVTETIKELLMGSYHTQRIEAPTEKMSGKHHLLAELVSCSPIDMKVDNDKAEVQLNVEGKNSAPMVIAMYADPDVVEASMVSMVTVIAEDQDGDELEFIFSATAGTLVHGGMSDNTAEWTAPPGYNVPDGLNVQVTAVVRDTSGRESIGNTEIYVLPYEAPPSMRNIEISASRIPNDGETEVRVEVEANPGYVGGSIDMVLLDLSRLGGRRDQLMNDNGIYGDRTPDDDIYSCIFTVPPNIDPGEKVLNITAVDDRGGFRNMEFQVEVYQTDVSTSSDSSPATSDLYIILPFSALALVLIVIIILVLGRRTRVE